MRIRLRPRHPFAASLTLIGCSLAAFAAGKYAVGIWSEYRDRIEFASSLTQGLPLLTIPDPRQRRANVAPSAAVMPIGLGVMEISRLNLAVLIRPGSSDAELDKGAGWIPGTARPGEAGNVCLAGHRDTFFRSLRGIRVGDTVVLKTPVGPRRYEVRETMVVEPNDTSVLRPTTQATLTLVTCFPFHYVGSAPKRFIVRATSTDSD
jgi:sortase A